MNTIGWAMMGTPVAIYLILIGSLHLRRRPLVTTGWRDILTLGIACCGLVIIGPMQLFFPVQASIRWPGWVWLPLLMLYLLSIILVILWNKPRLIVYGMSPTQFRDTLLQAAQNIDQQSNWIGEILTMPHSKIQAALEPALSNSVQSVVWMGRSYNLSDWLRLEKNLVALSRQTTSVRSRFGWLLVIIGGGMLFFCLTPAIMSPEVAAEELIQLLLR